MSQSRRSTPESTLRVMSWNIHKGIGGLDRRYDLNRIIAVLENYEPDVVLLQEVAQGIQRLKGHDQVELLTSALGLHSTFYPEHQFKGGTYGNLLLARWSISDPIHLDLTIGSRKRRGMIQAHIRAQIGKNQRTVVVHNMHLGLAGRERSLQLDRVMSSLPLRHLHQATPTIIGGDLNDLWGSLGAKHLAPHGFQRAGVRANTFPSALPIRPLDALFFRGGLKLAHYEVPHSKLTRSSSDHLPICADFVLLP